MNSVSALSLHTLMQPGPQGSTAPKAALACFPPEIWPCSEYWDTMLQRRNPGLTLSTLFRFAFCSGCCWGNHSAHHFQPGNSIWASSCLRFHVFGHPFGRGKARGNVELGLYNLFKKNYLHLFIDFLFPVKGESFCFFSLFVQHFCLNLWLRVWDLDINGLFLTFISSLHEMRMRKSRAQMYLLLAAGVWTSLALKFPIYLLHAKGMR